MKIGDIISYNQLCAEENATLQKGMNFRTKNGYSVFLMSVRPNAPYADRIEDDGKVLIYEGHDMPRYKGIKTDPKTMDQPEFLPGRTTLTENGKFLKVVHAHKNGAAPEIVKIYEKLKAGIWSFSGYFKLIDSWQQESDGRKVFKFKLELTEHVAGKIDYNPDHSRLIPTAVKIAVWKRDGGKCVMCGATTNLHFDHILPYSKGGSSLTEKNIQLLCAKCNLAKHDKII